ncbi:MAG: D-alanine--poly(phosphoribitol) ligase, partial [Actinobacteria bacterium]
MPAGWGCRGAGGPVGFLLHQLLADAAAVSPDREAVRCLGRSLTYGELDAAANAVARALIAGGVQPADRVAILLPKRVETIACVYGILKAGAAYVPLDPKGPARRAALVGADCTVKAVVTTPARAPDLLAALAEQGHQPGMVLLVDDATGDVATPSSEAIAYADVVRSGGTDPGVAVIEADLAYILYTSGSTGTPKGVMLSHRNALTFVEWSARRIGIGPDDRVSNHAPLHFDLSVFDLY